MKLGDIYENAIRWGIEADIRSKQEIDILLKKNKETYERLSEKDKEFFDKVSLNNPYSDTRILWGDEDKQVKTILVGIDIEVEEILLADRLREKGKDIDLIISHHPKGVALVNLYKVMQMQTDILYKYGVPINIAEGIMKERIQEVERKLLPLNYQKTPDAARLLGIPFMCIHTPTDNLVTKYLQEKIDKNVQSYWTLKDIIEFLEQEPEYKEAKLHGIGPKIIVGSETNRAGKVLVDMTGGTEGSDKAAGKLADAGIGTLIEMHRTETFRKEAEKYYLNIIIAGHMASDTIGMNLFLDKLQKQADIEIITCSGFIRVQRG